VGIKASLREELKRVQTEYRYLRVFGICVMEKDWGDQNTQQDRGSVSLGSHKTEEGKENGRMPHTK